jgi:hypothetical protein
MAIWQHMCGVYVWCSVWRCTDGEVQLASPHRMPHIHTKGMLPLCHNGPFIFLAILNSVTLTRKLRAP